MADNEQKNGGEQGQPDEAKVLLIAHVTAHLVNGESFDLLPIKHEEDVKTEVSKLIESWAQSGFLLRGRFVYPWHQVRTIEVLEVDELPQREAHQRLDSLYAADRARLQESFWKTRGKPEGKGEGEKGEGENKGGENKGGENKGAS